MTYQAQLNPWAVYRLLADFQRQLVARFRTRNEAEGYIKLIGQMQPHVTCALVFEAAKPLHAHPTSIAQTATTTKKSATRKTSLPTAV